MDLEHDGDVTKFGIANGGDLVKLIRDAMEALVPAKHHAKIELDADSGVVYVGSGELSVEPIIIHRPTI